MKIAICPLVSHDIWRAKRCIVSCHLQLEHASISHSLVVHINSLDESFADEMVSFCEDGGYRYLKSVSDGTPSTGKNAILDFLAQSLFDGACLVDDDDFLYPVSFMQIANHLHQFGETDLLVNHAMDCVVRSEFADPSMHPVVGDGVSAIVWGSNNWKMPSIYGTGPNPITQPSVPQWPISLGRHQYYSKRLAKALKFDPRIVVGEDVMLEFEALHLHQVGELVFFMTFGSDMYVFDRTLNNNIEKKHADQKHEYFRLIQQKLQKYDQERLDPRELPCCFPKIAYSYSDKIEFIQGLYKELAIT